jgi:hypothetical protein
MGTSCTESFVTLRFMSSFSTLVHQRYLTAVAVHVHPDVNHHKGVLPELVHTRGAPCFT